MKKLSIIIPVLNEEGNVIPLFKEIEESLLGKYSYETIFIDDGSTDNTFQNLLSLKPLKVIRLRKRFGQSSAIDAGIKASKGEIIVTLDGDMQNNPFDIPLLIEKLEEGYDVVSGWRFKRKDSFFKKIFSLISNFLRKMITKEEIHDSGCTLKAYRRECFNEIDLHGEMHRFIPSILSWQGFKITEVKVSHRPRLKGKTKYTFSRILKGLLDLFSLWFWKKYSGRPLHFFGGIGLLLSFSGTAVIIITFILRIMNLISLRDSIVPLAAFFLILIGINFFTSGLLMDVSLKNYYKERKRYNIKEIIDNQN